MSEAETNADISVIRGWGCTPTGNPPPQSIPTAENNEAKCLPKLLTKGWRKKSLYCIIIFLMILVFVNIALSLWIISTLRLSTKGMGPIRIVPGGIQLDGQAWVTDTLVASSLASRTGQPITLHSHRNFSVVVSEPNQPGHAELLMKRDSITCKGQSFQVHDAKGSPVFHASREEVRVYSDSLAIDGEGGITVKNSVQVPLVHSPPGSDLQLESLTRRLDLRAPQSIVMESRAGSIDVTSHSHIKLDSVVGAIKIDAPNIILQGLPEVNISTQTNKSTRKVKVYQLCACASGKLFLAAPESPCVVPSDDEELCR